MIKIHEIHEGSTLLVPSSMQYAIREQLVNLNLKRIQIFSIEHWLKRFDFNPLPGAFETKMAVHEKMKTNQPNCSIFQNICITPSFENECFSLVERMQQFSLTADQLPDKTPIQQELKMLLTPLFELSSANGRITQLAQERITEECTNLIIAYRASNFYEAYLIQLLVDKGATVLDFEKVETTYTFYHATNQRQEVEACAQLIIEKNWQRKDVQLYYCNSAYQPLIQQVFDRYQIPLTFIKKVDSSEIRIKTKLMLEFALNPNHENLLNCISASCFSHYPQTFYRQALQIYPINWNEDFPDLDSFTISQDILNEYDLKQIKTMIDSANEEKSLIMPYLNKLAEHHSIQDLFMTIDECLRTFSNKSEDDKKLILNLQQIFKEGADLIHDLSDYQILLAHLDTLSLSKTPETYDGIIASSLEHQMFSPDHLILLGATQKNFPAFKSEIGVFDENYLKEINGYPSLDQRYRHHLKQMLGLLKLSCDTIVTYPLSDYEGKVNEASLEVENTVQIKSSSIPLIQNSHQKGRSFTLSSQTAKQLYLKNGRIFGSVSSLEMYVGCPYAYFLRYGLKIKEPVNPQFNNQKIGTLSHYVMETLVKRYGKDYAKTALEEIKEIIEEKLNEVNLVYPQLDFTLIKERELISLMNNLKQLSEMEEHSVLTPTKCEAEFYHQYPITSSIYLDLKGYIDRIDENSHYFRIIDYKSSAKKLSEDKVFSGQQLQLVTYAMHMMDALKKQPLGAFYYSFKNENLSLPTAKLKRRPVELIETSKEDIFKANKKAAALNGWIFSECVSEMDDDATHVNGLAYTDKKGLHAKKIIDKRVLKHKLDQIYQIISQQILDGRIVCEPSESACMFCPYHAICRFSGNHKAKELLVEIDDTLYLNKAEVNENE